MTRTSNWPTTITLTLQGHISHLDALIAEATQQDRENGLYHVYDYGLNFNALRTSSSSVKISVYPQGELCMHDEAPVLEVPHTERLTRSTARRIAQAYRNAAADSSQSTVHVNRNTMGTDMVTAPLPQNTGEANEDDITAATARIDENNGSAEIVSDELSAETARSDENAATAHSDDGTASVRPDDRTSNAQSNDDGPSAQSDDDGPNAQSDDDGPNAQSGDDAQSAQSDDDAGSAHSDDDAGNAHSDDDAGSAHSDDGAATTDHEAAHNPTDFGDNTEDVDDMLENLEINDDEDESRSHFSDFSDKQDQVHPKKDRLRFPDFLTLVTFSDRCRYVLFLHEIKPFVIHDFSPHEEERVRTSSLDRCLRAHMRQCVTQAQFGFAAFPEEDELRIMFSVGLHFCVLRFLRTATPQFDEYTDKPGTKIPKTISSWFALLNEKKTDYSTEFKRHWTSARKRAAGSHVRFHRPAGN
ncbi:hypothetical protein SCP_0805230 [Sparassis crispa]|uniref:Uncharacterized protein n=1 Tax=Sparassis crispa TaxID=139825 RepID=A0A401GUY9_9APHY|nr:hypothetical protein SCP_0805230 [Sparassis crispa]GBE85999.1 hypothetical protein SCP_0805230 [Sparassis crispa]